jgi:hypothetical protein
MKYEGKVTDAAETVYASGCTALTELKADAAETVDASGCTALTELKTDAAETVYASGCTALTELKADAAKYVYAIGCTALTLDKIKTPITAKVQRFIASDLVPLLAAGGRLDEALNPQHWECHEWQNCPMAAAFGVTCLERVPSVWREKAEFFVRQFDCGLIRLQDALDRRAKEGA